MSRRVAPLHVAMQIGPYLHLVHLQAFGVWSLRILVFRKSKHQSFLLIVRTPEFITAT